MKKIMGFGWIRKAAGLQIGQYYGLNYMRCGLER